MGSWEFAIIVYKFSATFLGFHQCEPNLIRTASQLIKLAASTSLSKILIFDRGFLWISDGMNGEFWYDEWISLLVWFADMMAISMY